MTTVLVVGAGLSAAANTYWTPDLAGLAKPYPLASDLAACFDASYDLGAGVENAFQEAFVRRDHEPLKRLVDLLQAADHYLGSRAVADSGSIFARLLDAFPDAHFLSFNYDCLLELILLKRGLWAPFDGFGVTVDAEVRGTSPDPGSSRVKVIHLHGSLYLYAREFDTQTTPGDETIWLEEKPAPDFAFDPDALTPDFFPYERAVPDLRYQLPTERIIAPVPSKASHLTRAYVRLTYARAKEILANARQVIAVGYRFATFDRDSYESLLAVMTPRRVPLLVVSPHAPDIVARMQPDFPGLQWRAQQGTLEDWALANFAGAMRAA